jgi:hypothetical protein
MLLADSQNIMIKSNKYRSYYFVTNIKIKQQLISQFGPENDPLVKQTHTHPTSKKWLLMLCRP